MINPVDILKKLAERWTPKYEEKVVETAPSLSKCVNDVGIFLRPCPKCGNSVHEALDLAEWRGNIAASGKYINCGNHPCTYRSETYIDTDEGISRYNAGELPEYSQKR